MFDGDWGLGGAYLGSLPAGDHHAMKKVTLKMFLLQQAVQQDNAQATLYTAETERLFQ